MGQDRLYLQLFITWSAPKIVSKHGKHFSKTLLGAYATHKQENISGVQNLVQIRPNTKHLRFLKRRESSTGSSWSKYCTCYVMVAFSYIHVYKPFIFKDMHDVSRTIIGSTCSS